MKFNFATKSFAYMATLTGFTFGIGLAQNPEEMGGFLEGDIVRISPSLLMTGTRNGLRDERYRWKDGIIPYTIETNYPADLREMILQAMYEIESKTCIKFTPRTTQASYIHIMSGKGCYSFVGRIGGKQNVSLPTYCKEIGIFIHELIHAIGFLHEQSRSDRDKYVRIHLENVVHGFENAFGKYDAKVVSPFGVAYDYDSVMHYEEKAFSKNGKSTIVPLDTKWLGLLGQRWGMSKGDIAKINNMYCKKGHLK